MPGGVRGCGSDPAAYSIFDTPTIDYDCTKSRLTAVNLMSLLQMPEN